jgi:hypothetical protein
MMSYIFGLDTIFSVRMFVGLSLFEDTVASSLLYAAAYSSDDATN